MFLEGKGAVVTGGGRGIGAAVASALAQAGASVVLAARTKNEIETLASHLNKTGARAWAQTCDVTDPTAIALLAKSAKEHLRSVDILVNNAGIASSAPIKSITLEEWNRLFAVNATGTFLCTQAFLPGMMEHKWGRIVNIASVVGLTGAPYIAAYAASKHAVLGFTRSAAAEVASHGVTINAICPGYVNTAMTVQSIDRIIHKTKMSREAALETILKTSPQKRLIEPEEVAHAALSLCHANAQGINGQAIVLDGGGLLA